MKKRFFAILITLFVASPAYSATPSLDRMLPENASVVAANSVFALEFSEPMNTDSVLRQFFISDSAGQTAARLTSSFGGMTEIKVGQLATTASLYWFDNNKMAVYQDNGGGFDNLVGSSVITKYRGSYLACDTDARLPSQYFGDDLTVTITNGTAPTASCTSPIISESGGESTDFFKTTEFTSIGTRDIDSPTVDNLSIRDSQGNVITTTTSADIVLNFNFSDTGASLNGGTGILAYYYSENSDFPRLSNNNPDYNQFKIYHGEDSLSYQLSGSGDHIINMWVIDRALNMSMKSSVTISYQEPQKPAAPTVSADDTNNVIIGIAEGMEYSFDNQSFTPYAQGSVIDLSGDKTVYVRVAASGINPASDPVTLTFTINPVKPAVPTVSADDTNNVIIGIAEGMEYSFDNQSFTSYSQGSAIDLSGDKTVYVRVAASGINPASDSVTLAFTINPVKPAVPTVSADDTNNLIVGIAEEMEYSFDGTNFLAYLSSQVVDLSGDKTVYVRVAASGINPASDAVTLTFTQNPVQPGMPNVFSDDNENLIVGISEGMEYSFDNIAYTAYIHGSVIDLSGDKTVYVRIAASGINPASDPVTLTFTINPVKPAVPSVSADDTNNVIIGIAEGMEYSFDNVNYTAYRQGDVINLSGEKTVYVRIAASGINPASDPVTLTFTPNPVKPAVPTVSADDTNNVIIGIAEGMEYSFDNVNYTAYRQGDVINLSGEKTVYVRISASGINPASDPVTLTFTPNPVKPAVPSVSADDTNNLIVGIAEGMEYSFDNQSFTPYSQGSAIDLSGEKTVYVRVAASGINPVSDSVSLTFTTNQNNSGPIDTNEGVSVDDIQADVNTSLELKEDIQSENIDSAEIFGSLIEVNSESESQISIPVNLPDLPSNDADLKNLMSANFKYSVSDLTDSIFHRLYELNVYNNSTGIYESKKTLNKKTDNISLKVRNTKLFLKKVSNPIIAELENSSIDDAKPVLLPEDATLKAPVKLRSVSASSDFVNMPAGLQISDENGVYNGILRNPEDVSKNILDKPVTNLLDTSIQLDSSKFISVGVPGRKISLSSKVDLSISGLLENKNYEFKYYDGDSWQQINDYNCESNTCVLSVDHFTVFAALAVSDKQIISSGGGRSWNFKKQIENEKKSEKIEEDIKINDDKLPALLDIKLEKVKADIARKRKLLSRKKEIDSIVDKESIVMPEYKDDDKQEIKTAEISTQHKRNLAHEKNRLPFEFLSLQEYGVFQGVSKFYGESSLLKQDLLRIVLDERKTNLYDCEKNEYASIDSASWQCAYLKTAYLKNWIKESPSEFELNEKISRPEAMTFLFRVYFPKSIYKISQYKTEPWYKLLMAVSEKYGFTERKTIEKSDITYNEFVKIYLQILKYIEKFN